ncbi:MAG TPA: DNA double-strand break repair nuclease NurA, partial [Dehalococcoidia bacterium]|nr:DNA double-strand break repair nuclease NurA [Dehalococcoidia bacterium]
MSQADTTAQWSSEERVREDLQRQPQLFLKLAENALIVAESLRNNYFKNTAQFVSDLRKAMSRPDAILRPETATDLNWQAVQGEVVTFIDGGVGQVQISSQVPILLRVGSYCVRTGEHRLAEREQFGYYPVILGDLEGGSKERKDFIDIVRITAELLGGVSALNRTPDLRVLMFHGPLVYLVGSYAGHTPFTEHDIDLFLSSYAADPEQGRELKERFLAEARIHVYPRMMPDRADELSRQRLFEPLAWMAFLYRRLIAVARQRSPRPIIAGVVERGELREFSERLLLARVFQGLREKRNADYFNKLYGRTDLTSPKALLDKLGYTDALLLAMLLRPGQRTEAWMVDKYSSLHAGKVSLPGESWTTDADWSSLRPKGSGLDPYTFPQVEACYLHVSETTEPVRIEVFPEVGGEQMNEAAQRAYLYSRLLPGYGFPVGLDIADKFAKVPTWLTDAYGKLIKYHLGVSLQRGEISDVEMRKILVQAIYMTHRDWLFRPNA